MRLLPVKKIKKEEVERASNTQYCSAVLGAETFQEGPGGLAPDLKSAPVVESPGPTSL